MARLPATREQDQLGLNEPNQPNPPSLVSPKLHFYFPTIGEDNGDMIVKSGFDYRSGEARGTRGDTWSSRGARA